MIKVSSIFFPFICTFTAINYTKGFFPVDDLVQRTDGGIIERVHEISNNVLYATRKASNQPAHTRSLIRAFARRLSIL